MKVKIGFMEGAEEWQIKSFLSRFKDVDQSLLEFEIDQNGAEFLIAFPWIYGVSNEAYLQLLKDAPEKITIMDALGEAVAPDLNLFDYHIGFDPAGNDGRVLHSPYMFAWRSKLQSPVQKDWKGVLAAKKEFCNYIYSHGEGHPQRIHLFSVLSTYKKVNAIGKHLNNTPCTVSREAANWLEGSIMLKNPYKFSIACENAWYRGYTTEKIITSFLADSIPIYWGNPLVEEEYNPKAFINCHRYHSLEEVVAEIKRIDENDELWMSMMAEPKQLPWQIERNHGEKEELTNALVHIFTSPVEQVRKKGNGLWIDTYRNFFISNFQKRKKSRKEKLYSGLKKWNEKLFRGK